MVLMVYPPPSTLVLDPCLVLDRHYDLLTIVSVTAVGIAEGITHTRIPLG